MREELQARIEWLATALTSGEAPDAGQTAATARELLDRLREYRPDGVDEPILYAVGLVAAAFQRAGMVDAAKAAFTELVDRGRRDGLDDFDSLFRMVAARHALADFADQDDDLVEARAQLRRAVADGERLLAAAPGLPVAVRQFLTSCCTLASLSFTPDCPDEPAHEQALGLLRRGIRTIPSGADEPDHDLFFTVSHTAQLLIANDDHRGAVLLAHRYAEHVEQFHPPATMTQRLELASAWWLVGQAELQRDNLLAAHRAFRRAAVALPDDGDDAAAYDPARAEIYQMLARTADDLGEYAQAAALYADVYLIRRRTVPADHPQLLQDRYNIAEMLRVSGRVKEAAERLGAVADELRHRRDVDGSAHLLRLTLKNLASALLTQRRLTEAETTAREALAIVEEPDPDIDAQLHLIIVGVQRSRPAAYHGTDEASVAALARLRAYVDDPQATPTQLHLALDAAGLLPAGQEREVAEVLERALARLAEPATGNARSAVCLALINLAGCRVVLDDCDGALDALEQAVPLWEAHRSETWRMGSVHDDRTADEWMLAPMAITLAGQSFARTRAAVRLAFRVAAGRKRLQSELIARQRALVLEGREDAAGLVRAADQLRIQAWDPAGNPESEPATARAQLERVDTMLALALPPDTARSIFDRAHVSAVAAALPADTVLIDYVHCLDPGMAPGSPGATWSRCYVAFVLRAGDPDSLAFVRLGAQAAIDAAVGDLRAAIAGQDAAWRAAARGLAELIWDPLRHLVPSTGTVLYAPDGALCAVPFDALIGADGQPLLLTHTLSALGSNRDAARATVRNNWHTSEPLVIAAPEFGPPWAPFPPLDGARREGASVARLLNTTEVTGAGASRDVLLTARSPSILHIATHGVYLRDRPEHEHPLVRSALAFAGANDPEGRAGCLVTALDTLSIDLAGTDLVVLSACESGLGVLHQDEGLMGLARSFLLAGARAVVWTLWRVDDEASLRIMESFYEGLLWQAMARSSALRAAKERVYRDQPDRPDLWAAFVVQGDAGALVRHRFLPSPPEQVYAQTVYVEPGTPAVLDTKGRRIAAFNVRVGGLDAGPADDHPAAELLQRGLTAWHAGDEAGALVLLEDARALVGAREEPTLLSAEIYDNLSRAVAVSAPRGAAGRRALRRAVHHATVAQALYPRLPEHRRARATVLHNLGVLLVEAGRPSRALPILGRAALLYDLVNDPGLADRVAALTQVQRTARRSVRRTAAGAGGHRRERIRRR